MAEQGIFGPTPEQLEELRRQQQAERSAFAARVSPSYSAGFGVGNLLTGVVSKLFNLQDPAIAKASRIQAALKDVNASLTDEERANPALQYARVAQRFAQEDGLQNEAMQAQQMAADLGMQMELRQADIASKQATALKAQQDAMLKQQDYLREEQGRAALLEAAKTKGSPLTSEETIQVLSPFLPAEKLVPLLVGDENKKAWQNIQLLQITQAHEDRLAKIQSISDEKEKQREWEKEKLNFQRETALLVKQVGVGSARSSREGRYADAVAIAGNEAIGGIRNIVNLPSNVTGGFWGSGLPKTQAGTGLFEAPIGALKNELTPEAVQRYNAEIDNMGYYFAKMLAGGLSISQSDQDKFTNQFRIREGDKPLTALTKLAQMRQSFERIAEIKSNSKTTPEEQKELWQDWLVQVKEAIPVTVNDINKIGSAKDKSMTFRQLLGKTANEPSMNIPAGAIEKLRANPNLAKDFDAKFGPGSSKRVLGGQ
jgi:hypothetical protein